MTDEQLLLDVMLGKLATYLRFCGYDTLYAQDEGTEADDALTRRAESSSRVLVTRDQELAAQTDGALLLETREVDEQLAELAAHGLSLSVPDAPQRCGVCNGRVRRVSDDDPRPEHAPDHVDALWQCRACEQHFWKGSHWERMREIVGGVGDSNHNSL
jgi:uncharacterized protein with PIN domain